MKTYLVYSTCCSHQNKSSQSLRWDRFLQAKPLPGISSFTLFCGFLDFLISCHLSNSFATVVVLYYVAFAVISLEKSFG